MEEVKKHPLWHEVVDYIAEDVKEKGYGLFYSHQELRTLLGIPEPTTIEESEKGNLDYMSALHSLSQELLVEHNIHLSNKYREGYTVSVPDDQVTKEVIKRFEKAVAWIRKGCKVNIHVNFQMLSDKAKDQQIRNAQKGAFILHASRKRKFDVPPEPPKISESTSS